MKLDQINTNLKWLFRMQIAGEKRRRVGQIEFYQKREKLPICSAHRREIKKMKIAFLVSTGNKI